MKNSVTDYAMMLKSGFMPPKKNYDNKRRPFNHSNPNEFGYSKAALRPVTNEAIAVAATSDGNGVPFNTDSINTTSGEKKILVPVHIF